MAKQSVVAIPTEIKGYDQIQKVLLRLTEELDILLGYRGNNKAATDSQVIDVNEQIAQVLLLLNGLATTDWNTAFSWGDHAKAGYVKKSSNYIQNLITEAIGEYDNQLNFDNTVTVSRKTFVRIMLRT